MAEFDPIRMDFDPLDPKQLVERYPKFAHLLSLEWAIRHRKENGFLEAGIVIEYPYGTRRTRCKIVPALLNERMTGAKAQKPTEDLLLEQVRNTNDRLTNLEAQLSSLLTCLQNRHD